MQVRGLQRTVGTGPACAGAANALRQNDGPNASAPVAMAPVLSRSRLRMPCEDSVITL